jgi:hypothetical protein
MHSPHATWETGLVIPEATKTVEERTLDALLRIEELLVQLLTRKVEPEELPELVEEQFIPFPNKEAFAAAKSAQVTRKGKRK